MTDFVTTPLTPAQQAEAARLERQEPLKLEIPKGVAIIGCGGVGSWIAYMLALAGVGNLWLFDPDIVSENNLNRLLLPPSAIGKPKANALVDAITGFRPSAHLIPLGSFTPELADASSLAREIDYALCSTDSLASRRMVYKWASDCEITYIEAAAEGEYGSIAATPAEFATDAETQPGYASVPVWVGPCVIAAAMACTMTLRGVGLHRDAVYRLGYDRETANLTFQEPPKPTPAKTVAELITEQAQPIITPTRLTYQIPEDLRLQAARARARQRLTRPRRTA